MTSAPSPARKLFLLLGSVGLLAASFVLTAPRTASALPSQDCDCIYYSDASHTTGVGEREIFCNGSRYSWGTTSAYSSCFCTPC
ncbi:MAG TPA: DUF6289 family protein [Thermoanaerobaculia bacterium]